MPEVILFINMQLSSGNTGLSFDMTLNYFFNYMRARQSEPLLDVYVKSTKLPCRNVLSEYDQEMPQSHNTDQPTVSFERNTEHQEDN